MGCPRLTYQLKTVYRTGVAGVTREERVSRKNLKTTVDKGLYYYGARYYQSKLSVWLSVDPKAHWYPNKAPFNFSGNNPLNIIDPNGMWEQDPDGNWVAQKGDSAGSLARDAGISQSAAESIIRDYNSSNNHNRSSDIMVYVGDAVQLPGGNRSLKGQGTESSGITSSSSLAGPRIDIANLTAGANPLSTNSETLYQGISGLRLGNTVKQALIDYAETTGELSKGVSWYMEATKIFDYGLAIAQAHQIEKKFDLGEINNQSRYFEHTVNIGTTALLRNPVYSLAWSFGYDFLGPAVVNTEWYQYRVHGRKPKKSIIID
jgi:RHS repeat-associated protein